MTNGKQLSLHFPGFNGRKIEGELDGGEVSSDGAVLLLRQVDRWIGLTQRLAEVLPDRRNPDRITHLLESLLQQRLYGLALGYEDLRRS